jgi:hypothetical protein
MLVNYDKSQDKDEAFTNVKGLVTPQLMEKFQVKAQVDYNESDKVITAKGKGFELVCHFNDSACELDLKLSLMLKPFKNKVLEGLSRQVKKVI